MDIQIVVYPIQWKHDLKPEHSFTQSSDTNMPDVCVGEGRIPPSKLHEFLWPD